MGNFPIERIPRGVAPPKHRPPFIPFLKVGPYVPTSAVLVSSKLEQTEIHYWGGRSVPHTKPAESCEPCRDGWQAPKWYGFALVQLQGGKLCIARITRCAADSCPILTDKAANLRGKLLTLSRVKKSPQGEMRAELRDIPPLTHLAPELDLWAILLNLWGLHPDFPPVLREKGERFPGRDRPSKQP